MPRNCGVNITCVTKTNNQEIELQRYTNINNGRFVNDQFADVLGHFAKVSDQFANIS